VAEKQHVVTGQVATAQREIECLALIVLQSIFPWLLRGRGGRGFFPSFFPRGLHVYHDQNRTKGVRFADRIHFFHPSEEVSRQTSTLLEQAQRLAT